MFHILLPKLQRTHALLQSYDNTGLQICWLDMLSVQVVVSRATVAVILTEERTSVLKSALSF